MLFLGMLAMLYLIPVFCILTIYGLWKHHKFWRELKTQGRVVSWSEVRQRISQSVGILIVEIGPKGPAYSWWMDCSRNEIDPEQAVPSWHDFEEQTWFLFNSAEEYDRMKKWAIEHLHAYQSSAKAVAVSWSQLSKLDSEIKQNGVLVVVANPECALSWCLRDASRTAQIT